jgi:hypothetical protein
MNAQVLAMHPRPSRLADLEHVVEHGQRSFVEVAKALREIRDERLYGAEFGTFDAYCRSRFGMTRRALDYTLAAAAVVDNVRTIVLTVPSSESVVRPLAKLEPDEQRKVWSEATDRWRKPTAAQVTSVVRELFHKPTAPAAQAPEPSGPTTRLVLVLDDLEEAAKILSNSMELAKVERLHALLGFRIQKLVAQRLADATHASEAP